MKCIDTVREYSPCEEAADWLGDKTEQEAWEQCERADWLIWWLGKKIGTPGWPDIREIVYLAALMAQEALRFVPAGEERPRIAVETIMRWYRGEATIEECEGAAADAARAAACAAYAAARAAYAAYAAARAAACAAYADACAADAVACADYAAADAAEHRVLCDIIRFHIQPPFISTARKQPCDKHKEKP